jgi:hypothetical protein
MELWAEAWEEEGELHVVIARLKALANQCPGNSRLQGQLKLACKEVYEEGDMIVKVWEDLVGAHPMEDGLVCQLREHVKNGEMTQKGWYYGRGSLRSTPKPLYCKYN